MTVAARAGELPVLGLRINPVLQRMARLGKTACNMKLFRDFWMAPQAEVIYRHIQHGPPEGRMRLMAYHTQARRDDRMHVLVREHRLVVAVVAEVRQLFPEQPFEIRLMRLMTGHAHARGNRRMLYLQPHDLAFAVAFEADVRDLVAEQLFTLPCMGVMAHHTLPVVNRAVHPEFSSKESFIMADEAELGRGPQKQFIRLSAVRVMA